MVRIFQPRNLRLLKNVSKLKVRTYASQNETDLSKHRSQMMARGLPKIKPIEGVKDIILVCSGKGGVGKSTTSVNLACAMKVADPNKGIGLLDTDVFGPSIPLMMNLNEYPLLNKSNLMIPLLNYGVKCMSMGFLIEDTSPVIWRGLMVMQAIDKLLRQVVWENIDYLIIDTPPGTGDTLLSLIQNIPISGVVLVTTPQSASLQVTKRGAMMFKKLSVPIIGIVENMSSVTCPSCAHCVQIFGDGTKNLASEIETKILVQFPLNSEISNCTDTGTPIMIAKPNCDDSKKYLDLAKQIMHYVDNK